MKRQRRPPQPGEFEDPLSNYEPPDYADEFERALCEQTVEEIDYVPLLKVSPDTRVVDAMRQMAEHGSACIVVVDELDKPIGIFSERDVLNTVVDRYDQMKDLPVREVMTVDPYTVYRTDSPAQVLNLMGSGGFRHVPVVNADGKLIGLIGARRITAWLKHYFPNVESA